VSEYTEEFNILSSRNDLNESATQLVARSIGGLKDNIQDQLELNSVWSMPQAVNLAMKIEVQQNRKPKTPYYRRHWQEPTTTPSKMASPPMARPSPSLVPSAPTGGSSETTTEGKTVSKPKGINSSNPYACPSTLKCFRCSQSGHKSNECPQRKQVQLAEFEDGLELEDPAAENHEDAEDVQVDGANRLWE